MAIARCGGRRWRSWRAGAAPPCKLTRCRNVQRIGILWAMPSDLAREVAGYLNDVDAASLGMTCRRLFEAVATMMRWKEADLTCCLCINDIQSIVRVSCRLLTYIDLTFCELITNDNLPMLASCRQLRYVSLISCTNIGGDGFVPVVRHLLNATQLASGGTMDLAGCYRIVGQRDCSLALIDLMAAAKCSIDIGICERCTICIGQLCSGCEEIVCDACCKVQVCEQCSMAWCENCHMVVCCGSCLSTVRLGVFLSGNSN